MRMISRGAITLSLLLPLVAAAGHGQAAAPASAQPLRAVGPQAGFGDVLVLGNGARFELATAGGAVLVDGVPAAAGALAGPWSPGTHAITVQAAAGEAVAAPLQFVYDPAPPTIEWQTGDTHLLDSFGLDQDVESRDKPPKHLEPERDGRVAMIWSPDGRRWLPVLAKGGKAEAQGALADWTTAADRPQIFLWALEDGVLGAGAPVAPKKLQLVRVWGGDALSAVREMRLRVLPAAGGALQLEIVATDIVGNQATVRWPLAGR